jgi:copper homeostasis protein
MSPPRERAPRASHANGARRRSGARERVSGSPRGEAPRIRLEVIVQSLEDARAAAAGGADRLEVVRDLDRRGLTPDLDLVRAMVREVQVPLRIMIRESDGFSVASPDEVRALRRALSSFAALPIDGVVLGFARDERVDLDLTNAVLSAAPHVRVTFHHAFDEARDPFAALEALGRVPNVDRVLTTGGSGTPVSRAARLAEYVTRAGPAITVLAGGGVDAEFLSALAAGGVVEEAHAGRAARDPATTSAPVSADRVRMLKSIARSR